MPQKRNPDIFHLVRGRTAPAHACLPEALEIFAKLPPEHQRDLQLLKLPLFRGAEVCAQMLDIIAAALAKVMFDEAAITAKVGPSIHASDQA